MDVFKQQTGSMMQSLRESNSALSSEQQMLNVELITANSEIQTLNKQLSQSQTKYNDMFKKLSVAQSKSDDLEDQVAGHLYILFCHFLLIFLFRLNHSVIFFTYSL